MGKTISEHIKTEYEMAVEFDDLQITGDKKWISLDWLEKQVKKRRDMFKDLGGTSKLTWVLKLLQLKKTIDEGIK